MTLPSFSLEGKTCVVTGAARGLGKEFLTGLALSGAKGACVDLSLDSGRSSIAQIKERVAAATGESYAPELNAYECDVTSEAQVQETWARIVSDFGKVDCVVTAAGIVDNVEAENYAFDRWRKMFDINVHGSFLFAREAGKYWIREQIRGNLILVSSMSAKICVRPQKQAAYNAVRCLFRLLSICRGSTQRNWNLPRKFSALTVGTVKGSCLTHGAKFMH
jgi:NAD(P)-dependent dehydrogenase (short-subunit alcohol dehydrogenase family)